MPERSVQTSVPCLLDRSSSPRLAGPFAAALELSEVVDYVQFWDQLTSWWPRRLWTRENSPLAEVMPDCDSFHDAFVLAAFAAAATTRLGVAISTDAIRRGPAELLQSMLTLAAATDGRAVLMLGAGELKQAKPFGYRRAEGLARLEDALDAIPTLAGCTEPVDFQGNFVNYHQAWIGATHQHTPEVWALGGGPRLTAMSAKSANGYATIIPSAFPTAKRYAAQVDELNVALESNGRDAERFSFGLWAMVLLHEDSAVIERALHNPLFRFLAGIAGRMNQADWELEGLKPVMPDGWHYAIKLLPAQMSEDEIDAIVDATSPEMVAKTFFTGTPAEVADEISEYVDAGATWVSVVDMLPMMMPMEEALAGIGRSIEVCRILKS